MHSYAYFIYFPISETQIHLPFIMSYQTIHPLPLPFTPQPARCPIWLPHLWAPPRTNLRQSPARHKRSRAGLRLRTNATCPQLDSKGSSAAWFQCVCCFENNKGLEDRPLFIVHVIEDLQATSTKNPEIHQHWRS